MRNMEKCRVIAVANQKGGVGKTTTVRNLCKELAEQNMRVCAIDFDSQASLTISFGIEEPSQLQYTIAKIIKSYINRKPEDNIIDYVKEITKGWLYFFPTNIELAQVELLIVGAMAREYLLKRLVERLRPVFDYILIDCPPNLGMLSINAMTAADGIIIPVAPKYLDWQGFNYLYDSIQAVRETTNPKLKIYGVLFTLCDDRLRLTRKVKKDLADEIRKKEEQINIFNTSISLATKVAEASEKGISISQYASESKVASEYKRLTMEVINFDRY